MSYGKIFLGDPINGAVERAVHRGRVYTLYNRGFVYFAEFTDGPSGLVKIGWSQNPWSRVRELGFEFKEKLVIRELVQVSRGSRLWGTGYKGLERRLHDTFSALRVDLFTGEPSDRGEWFRLSPEQVQAAVSFAKRAVEEARVA